MSKEQQLLNALRDYNDSLRIDNDSLKTADSLHCAQLDSVKQALNDSIASLHQKIDGILANEKTGDITGSDLFWLILCLAVAGLLCWFVWYYFLSSYYKKTDSPIKKGLILLLIPVLAFALTMAGWLVFAWYQYIIIICIVAAITWWLFKNYRNNMGEKKDFTPDYDDKSGISAHPQEETQVTTVAMPCIAAVASDTRKVKNQDGFCEAYIEKAQARIIAIADGVGSSFNAEKGSQVVTAKAVELVKHAIESNKTVNFDSIFDKIQIDFDGIFDQVQLTLDAEVENEYTDEHQLSQLKPASYGTTLIIGIDLPDRFIAAYVGNGSIWHVSGLFNTFPSMVCLPWNAVNLLTPDTIMSGGKEALYKIFFYKGEKKHHKPTVLQISKLNEAPGDMFILTTDGVYSSDHAVAAKDDDGDIWIPSTAQFGLLHDMLKAYVEGNEDINDETLKQMLVRYLAHIKEAKIMDDDTTLGVFISAEAKKHFMDKRKGNETN